MFYLPKKQLGRQSARCRVCAGRCENRGGAVLLGNSFNQADLCYCTILYGTVRVMLRAAATEVGALLTKEIMRKVKTILRLH